MRTLQVEGTAQLRDGTKDHQADPDAINTYNVKLALAVWRSLHLTGSFDQNPASGRSVRHVFARTMGVESDIGSLKFRGQYGIEREYTTAKQSQAVNIGFDLRLTHWDTLSTTFEGHDLFDDTLSATTIYRLAFTHRLGSAFDLSVGGSVTRRSVSGVDAPDQDEVKGEAKLGLHF